MRTLIAVASSLLIVCGATMAPADLVRTIDAHYAAVTALAVTPDGNTVFSTGKDGQVKVWDTTSLELVTEMPGCQQGINDVAVDQEGTLIATAGADGFIKVWDAWETALIVAIPAHDGPANTVYFHPDEPWIFSGGDDGYIRVWNMDNDYELETEFLAHNGGVNDIITNAAGDYLFSCGVDGKVTVYDVLGMVIESQIQVFERGEALCLSLNHLESCLATGGTNGEVRIWDAATGAMTQKLRAHAGNVNYIYFIEDDTLMVTGGEDGKLKLWNHDGEKAGEMQAHVLGVRNFLLNGEQLFTCGADYKIRVWDAHF